MKKRTFTLLLVALTLAGLMSSCLKEDDFDGLYHPLHVTGHFNPELGVPLGYASLTVSDLLNMFSDAEAYVYVTDDSLVGLHFDTTVAFSIDYTSFEGQFKRGRLAKEGGDSVNTIVKVLTGEVEISKLQDLYNQADFDLSLKNLFVNLGAKLRANCPPNARQDIEHAGLEVMVDSIIVEGTNANQVSASVRVSPSNPITLDNFFNGDSVVLLDYVDVSQLASIRPYKFRYAFRVTTRVNNRQFEALQDLYSYVSDSLDLISLDINADCSVDFPLSLSLTNFTVDTCFPMSPVELEYDLTVGNIRVDSSALVLEFDNKLPFALEIGASLIDSTGREADVFAGGRAKLQGGQLSYNGSHGTYVVSQPNHSEVVVAISQEVMQVLPKLAKLRLSASVSSAEHNGNYPVVSVQTFDGLQVRAYVKASAELDLDIPLTSSAIVR